MKEFIIEYTNGKTDTLVAEDSREAWNMLPAIEGHLRDNKTGEWLIKSFEVKKEDI